LYLRNPGPITISLICYPDLIDLMVLTVMNEKIGKYQLVKQLSSHPTCRVYLAHLIAQPAQRVVVRLFEMAKSHHSSRNPGFACRAAAIKQVKHIYLLPLLEIGLDKDDENIISYLASPYVSKGSLQDRLNHLRVPLSNQEVHKILFQLGQVLTYLHERGLVHGNIKPTNILFNEYREVQLTDFNLACEGFEACALSYLAPEQLMGMATRASDQYALACVAYQLFTGQAPFGTSPGVRVASDLPISLTRLRPDLPMHIDVAVLKALSFDPAARYENIYAFISALSTTLERPGQSEKIEALVETARSVPEEENLPCSLNEIPVEVGSAPVVERSRASIHRVALLVAVLIVVLTGYMLRLLPIFSANTPSSSISTPQVPSTPSYPDARPTIGTIETPHILIAPEITPTSPPQNVPVEAPTIEVPTSTSLPTVSSLSQSGL
jgi:serine/threonine protein kinase